MVRKYFGKALKIEEKSCAWDFRTEADVRSEVAIIKVLERAFPSYNILSEECGLIDKKLEGRSQDYCHSYFPTSSSLVRRI